MSFQLTYSTMFDPPEALHREYESALAQVQRGLGSRHVLHIDGKDCAGAQVIHKTNPANRSEVLGEFASGGPAELESALRAAHVAFPAWRALPPARRLELLRRAGQIVQERVFAIAACLSLEVGKNRMEAIGEAQEVADFFRIYCDDYERNQCYDRALLDDPIATGTSRNRSVLRPYGAWAVIAPFNFPIALAAGPVSAALVCGNTVVLKGSEATPWAGRLLADCLRDAGLPPGVFNYLGGTPGELGRALVAHPLTAGVTFTGSHAVGMQIARQVVEGPYPRPLVAEMGGKNACIVTSGANLEHATAGIARSAFGMCGQKCSALSRLYVHASVADALIERLVAHIGGIRIGDPTLRENWLGPLATAGGHERYAGYHRQLSAGGARILAGAGVLHGSPHDAGWFVSPLLAEAPVDHPLWRTEMFAPILMVHRVQSNDEAMRLANDSNVGLTAGFYGTKAEVPWFQQHIEAGVTLANRPQGATTGAWPGYQAFAGWKGSSSTGKAIGSFYYLPQYMREQSLTVVE